MSLPKPHATALLAAGFLAVPAGCTSGGEEASAGDPEPRSLQVQATAYNSLPEQTDSDHPDVAAWGDILEPGTRAIAVSRDLEDLGLTHGTEVEIEGVPGTWVVRDRMHPRWRQRIDLYMGEDVEAAREWGRRTVTIHWQAEP